MNPNDEHPLKVVFKNMKQRCYNKNYRQYKYYGAKGIIIWGAWLFNPHSFYQWADDNGWEPGKHIHRKDNHKGYQPDNCEIICSQQHYKIHNTKKIKINVNNP